MENSNKIIGENIAKYRRAFDMTQLDLAEKLNYSDKAVSKWERGDAVPDVSVLMNIADLFGVTLNDLCYEHLTTENTKIKQHKKTKHFYITMLSVGLCWLIATITFTLLLIFAPSVPKKWLAFIFALPVSAIVALILNSLWGKEFWNWTFVSIIIWGTLLSICLSVDSNNINWLYLIGAPLEVLTIIWFFFKGKIIEKIQLIKKYKSRKKFKRDENNEKIEQ